MTARTLTVFICHLMMLTFLTGGVRTCGKPKQGTNGSQGGSQGGGGGGGPMGSGRGSHGPGGIGKANSPRPIDETPPGGPIAVPPNLGPVPPNLGNHPPLPKEPVLPVPPNPLTPPEESKAFSESAMKTAVQVFLGPSPSTELVVPKFEEDVLPAAGVFDVEDGSGVMEAKVRDVGKNFLLKQPADPEKNYFYLIHSKVPFQQTEIRSGSVLSLPKPPSLVTAQVVNALLPKADRDLLMPGGAYGDPTKMTPGSDLLVIANALVNKAVVASQKQEGTASDRASALKEAWRGMGNALALSAVLAQRLDQVEWWRDNRDSVRYLLSHLSGQLKQASENEGVDFSDLRPGSATLSGYIGTITTTAPFTFQSRVLPAGVVARPPSP